VRALGPLVALVLLTGASTAEAASRLVIRGAGFGHGIGLSQYGAYGQALQGIGYRDILARYYTGTALAELDANPSVRVLLQGGRRRISFSGAVRIGDRALDPALTYNVIRGGDGLVLRRGSDRLLTTAPPLRVEAPAGGFLVLRGVSVPGVRDGRYRGALEVRPTARGVNAINALDLESYVRGVVSAESPPSWPAEALRAQAVAARTYAITSRAGSIGEGFEQYADTRSQVYRGVAAERPSTDAAVKATAGQVVTYGGRPVTTFFFSTSGGHTENVENSFVGSAPRPWLKGVEDPYDDISPRHRWRPISMSTRHAGARLRGLVQGTFRRIKVLQRGVSPRVVRAEIIGSRGRTQVTGPQLRARLGLADTWAYFTTITSRAERSALAPQTPVRRGARARAAAVRAPVLRGSVSPARPGASVRVQRRRGGRWTTVVNAQLGTGGRYGATVPGAGLYRVRYGDTVVGPAVRVR
jgi:stage II sporulation protein D